MISYLMSLGGDGSSAWRALAVALLALSVFVLKRYWDGLEPYARRTRLLLVSLRATVFVLLICALAGVRLDYERTARGRVLVRYAQNESLSARTAASAIERTVAALRARGFEAVTPATPASIPFMPERDESFAAAVLLTDAALDAGQARREIERTSAQVGGAPVYVLAELQENVGPTVALESVEVLGRPARGVPLTLRCMVHGRGMSGHESLVTIADAARVQASARVIWRSDDERQAVALEVVPKVAGWANYLARIEAAGGEDPSVLTRSCALYVEERRMRVLFLEGEPTWEAKFVRRALEQTGLFELDYFAQVSRTAVSGATTDANAGRAETVGGEGERTSAAASQGIASPPGSASPTGVASPEARLHAALQSAASLNSYDAIIVGATPNTLLSQAEAARLGAWVERRGGGLIILGGNSFAGSIAAPGGRLYALLPAEVETRSLPSETEQQVARGAPLEAERTGRRHALVPTDAGLMGPLHGYANAAEGATPEALTGEGFSLRALRPGATVLASAGQAAAQAGAVAASNAGEPLVAAMRYGAGRVTLFAPADSWRIRSSASGAQDDVTGPFGALWQGLTLWAAEGARPQVEIVLDEDAPAAGREVTAELRVRDRSFVPVKLERVKARLQPLAEEGGETTTGAAQPQEILFTPDKTDQSIWRARFNADAPSQFSIAADYLAGRESGSTEKRFAVVAPGRIETGAALDTLQRTAREHDADLFAADQINALLERLSASHAQAAEKVNRSLELRTWWPLALLLPLMLCAEWLKRAMINGKQI